jgi:hypothetical protein
MNILGVERSYCGLADVARQGRNFSVFEHENIGVPAAAPDKTSNC